MNGKYDAVWFDLFGTILHGNNHRNYVKFLNDLGLDREQKQEFKNSILTLNFPGFKELFCYVKANILNREVEIDSKPYEDKFKGQYFSIEPGAGQVLMALNDEGYKTGVFSNVDSFNSWPFYFFGLDQLVDDYVLSCETGVTKTSENYANIRERLGLEKALMVGNDYYHDFLAAKQAGHDALLFDPKNKYFFVEERIDDLCKVIDYVNN